MKSQNLLQIKELEELVEPNRVFVLDYIAKKILIINKISKRLKS